MKDLESCGRLGFEMIPPAQQRWERCEESPRGLLDSAPYEEPLELTRSHTRGGLSQYID